MTDLTPYQFELDGVRFGLDLPIAMEAEGFDPGTDSADVQDVFNRFTDSFSFGDDGNQPANWTFSMFTGEALEPESALASLRVLGRKWDNRLARRTPGAVVPLRYCLAWRTRVVYGRPRNFGYVMNNGLLNGYLTINAEFQRADRLFYEDELRVAAVGIQPSVTLGLMSPLISPITTLVGTTVPGTNLDIGGDEPAPFEVTITGPVTNPRLRGGDWEIQLLTSIDVGQSVVISTYPWAPRAVRDDGAILSGYLSPASRLSKARLDPDGETLKFDGIDSSGDSGCTVRWRAAYTTI